MNIKQKTVVGVLSTIASLTVAVPSHATSGVTLYGVADVGVEYLNHVPDANKQSANLVRMTSGNIAGSRWGLRGVEELGGGLSALFVLEGGLAIDTGASTLGGRLFGRKAYVGLGQAGVGQLTLGRQHSVIFDLVINFDPMTFSPKYSSFAHDSAMNSRADNAAKYVGSFGGLTAEGLYSTGTDSTVTNGSEVPGNSRAGREMSAGFTYEVRGLQFGSVFDQVNGPGSNSGKTERRYLLMAAYQADRVKAFVGYRRLVSQLLTSMTRTDLVWTGASWDATRSVSLTGAVYKTNDRTSAKDPLSMVASVDYHLSKRTDAYLTGSYTLNKAGSALGANGYDGSVVPGANQIGAVIGMRHTF